MFDSLEEGNFEYIESLEKLVEKTRKKFLTETLLSKVSLSLYYFNIIYYPHLKDLITKLSSFMIHFIKLFNATTFLILTDREGGWLIRWEDG